MKWNAICDRCGAKRLNHLLRKQWNGLIVCADTCFEFRNAQDFVRGVADRQNPPWVRPEPTDVFVPSLLMLYEDGALMLLEQQSDLDLIPPVMALEDDTP